MMKQSVLALALVACALVVAAPVAAEEPAAWCTLSYPGECQASVGGAKLHCSGVGAVPDCRAT